MEKGKYNVELVRATMVFRGLAPRDIYRKALRGVAELKHVPGEMSRATLTRILGGKEVSHAYAESLAKKLGLARSSDLIDPELRFTTPLRDYLKETIDPSYVFGGNQLASAILNDSVPTSLPPPPRQEMDDFGGQLVGAFYLYQFTRGAYSGEAMPVYSAVSIDEMGFCTLVHSASKTLRYKGVLHFERSDSVVMILDSSSKLLPERIVYRFHYPIQDDAVSLRGVWLGRDRANRACASSVLLSERKISLDEFRYMAAREPTAWVDPLGRKRDDVFSRVLEEWNDNLITDDIQSCHFGSEINFLSIFYPANNLLYDAFLHKLDMRRKRNVNGAKLKVKILFLDYRAGFNFDSPSPLMEARFRLYDSRDDRDLDSDRPQNDAPKTFSRIIRRQVEKYLGLAYDYRDVMKMEVMLFESWPFAHYFKIGNKAIYQGVIATKDPAIFGPMMIHDNPDSKTWKFMERNFKASYDNAIDTRTLSSEELGFINPFISKE